MTVLWKRVVTGLCGVIALWSVFVGMASADTAAVTQQIIVHATVLPARYIIVTSDNPGTITTILSNTSEIVEPIVHIDSVSGHQIPLTQALREQYQLILGQHPGFAAGEIHPGHIVPPRLLSKYEFTQRGYNVTGGTQKRVGSAPLVYNASRAKRQGWLDRQKLILHRIGIRQLAPIQTVQDTVGYDVFSRITNNLGNL